MMNTTLTVLGGLAIFVYGMGLMSDGLKETAGEKLKAALGYMTQNRFLAVLAGAIVTALVQSSSATSVMTVGFVNAGLLTLQQAIGVIFGANIGTTVTGQIVALRLDDLSLPAVALGVVGLMAARRTVSRGVWRTVLGFGFLFFGMGLMSAELKTLAREPAFLSFFSHFDCAPNAADGFLPIGPVFGAVGVGLAATVVVQSSSAVTGIVIALSSAGILSLWTAVPIILGTNIGTTVTAAFAAIGGNANARRTALAHALFNVLGTLLVLASFAVVTTDAAGHAAPFFFHAVEALSPGDGFAGENPGRSIAMAHTLFNVLTVLVLLPFIPALTRFCNRVIADERRPRVVLLEPHLVETPELALHAARQALGEMTRRAWTVASATLSSCLGRTSVDEESVLCAEREIDAMQGAIRDYVVAISRRKLTERQAAMLPELIHCVNDAERISDIAVKVFRKSAQGEGVVREGELRQRTGGLLARLRTFTLETVHIIRAGELLPVDAKRIESDLRREARDLSRQFVNQGVSGVFLTVLSAFSDITRHVGNIAERIAALT